MVLSELWVQVEGPETGPMVLSELWGQVEGTRDWSHGPIRAVGSS